MKIYSSKTHSWSDSSSEASEGVKAADELSEMNTSSRSSKSCSRRSGAGKKGRSVKGADDLPPEDEDLDEGMDDGLDEDGDEDVEVDPDVEGLVFDPEDVGELLANVTGEDVEVEVGDTDDTVKFRVGDEDYTVSTDEDTEVLEARKISDSKSDVSRRRSVKSSTRMPRGRVVRTIRK